MFIVRQIKSLKIFGLRTWCTKKLFGYRVAHHSNTFKHLVQDVKIQITTINLYKELTKPLFCRLVKTINYFLIRAIGVKMYESQVLK